MKCIRADLPESLEYINLEIFSDLHIGSKKCDYAEIQRRIEAVKSDANRYAVILGDICNNSTKTSVGDVYEDELTPMKQVQQAVLMFEPIADKIIGITAGNHERRSYKTDGIDLGYFFARELGLQDKYDYCACLLFVRFGELTRRKSVKNQSNKVAYSIYMTHGDGQGGRTIGGKMNGLQRRGQIVDADIVITGHTHSPATFRSSFFKIDYQNSCVRQREQIFVNASSCLNYEEYAELYGMAPSSNVSPVIKMSGREKLATVIS